jgi:hypothetical protein
MNTTTMKLHEIDLVDFCNLNRVSQAKFEAAQDYLRTLATNPDAQAPKPLRRYSDRKLIVKVNELAMDATYYEETGLDRIERALVEHARWYDWFTPQEEAGLEYMRALRKDSRAPRPTSLGVEQCIIVEDLAVYYPKTART